MNKSLIFLCMLAQISSLMTAAYAMTPATSSATASTAASLSPTINPQIDALKARIASKVAELKLVEKRGFVGTVTETTDTQITVLDRSGSTRYIDVDELTKFSSPTNKNFGISDIQKGTTVGILGLYNKDSQRMLARFVDVLSLPQIISGAIGAIDKKNYQLTIITNTNKKVTIDIQNTTKTYTYDGVNKLAKAGFSKLMVNKRMTVVGVLDSSGTINALRVIEYLDIPFSPLINVGLLQELSATPSASLSPSAK